MVKITELPLAGPIVGNEVTPIVQGEESKQTTIGDLVGYHGRAYQTYAAREASIPMAARYNGLTVWVMEDVPRQHMWVVAGTVNPMTYELTTTTEWVGFYTPRETKNASIDVIGIQPATTIENLPETVDAVDTLATIAICDFRAVAQTSGTNPTTALSWSVKGILPSAFYLSWGASLITLAGTARGFVPKDWAAIKPLFIIGNSLSDTSDRTDGWPQLLAADRGVGLFSAARYSSDASQVYRCGAESLYLTLAGGILPTGGTSASVSLINGAAPSASLSVNPASFLNTGDAAITTNVSMTGTIVAGTYARRGTVSIPNGASTAYSIVQDAGGAAINLTGPVLFIPDLAQKMATCDLLMWPGNNYFFSGVANFYGDYTNPQMWVDMAKMVAKADGNRVVILPIIPDSNWTARGAGTPYTAMLSANARTEALYPAYVARDAAGRTLLQRLQASGDGSANDNADIAAGFVPRSLHIAGDTLHLNAAGQAIVYAFAKEALARQSLPSPITQSTAFSLRAVGVNPRTGAALENIAVATVQTGPLAALADQVAGSISAAPYRPTLAAAVADLPVDAYFSSRDTAAAGPHAGLRWNYRRIAAAPGWQALDAWAAPQDVGLGNVANLAPEAMPVSAAQQAALNTKADGAATTTALGTKTNTVDLASSASGAGAALVTRNSGENVEVAAVRADLAAKRTKITYDRHYRLMADLGVFRAEFIKKRYRRDGGPSTRADAINGARSGPATYPPLALPISTYADGEPRITTDGQVVERATTNQIDSPAFAGAVVGTRTGGGALPTGWTAIGDWEVVSLTTADGAQKIRLRLFRLSGNSTTGPNVRMAAGANGKSVGAATRGGWLLHGMMQLVSFSGVFLGASLSMLEMNGANTTPVGGNTAQSPTGYGLTAAGAMQAVRGFRAGTFAYISPRLQLTLSHATDPYEVVVDLTIPQVEDAASIDDYTTWINGTRNAETAEAKPSQYDPSLDVFIQGKTAGLWQLGRANGAALPVAPSSGSVISQVNMLPAGQLTGLDDRANFVEAVAPANFGFPLGSYAEGDSVSGIFIIPFAGRLYVPQNANGRLMDGAKPWAVQTAHNRANSVRFEVRPGDYSWSDGAITDKERSQLVSGWKGYYTDFGSIWQNQYSFVVEPGPVNPLSEAWNWLLLTQWHGKKESADAGFSPPASLQILTIKGVEYLCINMTADTQRPIVTYPSGPDHIWTDPLPLVRGKRYHVVERVKWSRGAAGGLHQMWLYDVDAAAYVQMLNYSGPTGYNNSDTAPYWDFGIYRAATTITMAVRFDNVISPVIVAAGAALPAPIELA